MDLRKAFKRYGNIVESFVHKTRSKKNTDLISKADSDFVPDGVYILHETLGVRGVEGWNKKFNNGVIGILVVEDEHQIVIALEDSPEELWWSMEEKLVNRPVDELEDAKSDFNGEEYCKNLNSPEFPAAYYCLNYNKGGRNWYLPSMGELWLIRNHIEEIQTALSIVGGQKLVTKKWDDFDEYNVPWYWSSTENDDAYAWCPLDLEDGYFGNWRDKVFFSLKVRPISKFQPFELKESFTKKISSKKNIDLVPDLNYPDGVYILHKSLGVKSVEGWNTKFNEGVIGVLVIEGEHQIVVALEESPEDLTWSKNYKMVNRQVEDEEYAEDDFNGEEYCKRLNSPEFPAAYYCSNYKKGGRSWYLPSSGELWLIGQHLEEIQTVLSIVGGKKFVTTWDDGPFYWSSTERSAEEIWYLDLVFEEGILNGWDDRVGQKLKVRPVSNFRKKNTLKESFTKKISSKKNSDLISKPSFVPDNGVYILHETLGVRTVEGWNPEDNDSVVGILLIEDDHKIVVSLEDAPEELYWSKGFKLVNQPIKNRKDAESDFNGEEYYRNLNSPDFPAAYYCLNYKKGDRNWYLPSSGELWMIYRHLEEIQTALSIVEGKKFVDEWDDEDNVPCYWSSTEYSVTTAWHLHLDDGALGHWISKVSCIGKVRPISKFQSSELKESFTKKIGKKNVSEIFGKSEKVKKFLFE